MTDTVIWERVRQTRKGPRPTHTLDDIAHAAIALGDSAGIGAVSIRAVAAELDAGAASLYRYITRKDDLHDLMVDAVTAELGLPGEPSGNWEEDVALVARRVRDVHVRHPWMAELAPHASWGPNTLDYMEFFLSALGPTGLELAERIEFIGLMNAWIASFTRVAQRPSTAGAAARMRHFATIAADPARPTLSAALRALMRADPSESSPDRLFERGLRRLVRGIARR